MMKFPSNLYSEDESDDSLSDASLSQESLGRGRAAAQGQQPLQYIQHCKTRMNTFRFRI